MHRRSVRLRLNKSREGSATASTTSESVPSHWDDGEPPELPLAMSIALRSLMAKIEAEHDRIDFDEFVDLAESPKLPYSQNGQHWKRVVRSTTFTLLKRNDEVLALARLDATVEEVASVLSVATDRRHTAIMRGLYGDVFISGSVAYVQRSQDNQHHHQLAVKTSNFVRPDRMSKNEQWCYGELLRREGGNSFTLVQGSLPGQYAQSLPARLALKEDTGRVAQLRGVSTAYLVEKMPGSHSLRIIFHAAYKPSRKLPEDEESSPIVLRSAVRSRLLRFARGVSHLSQLVRRRRFGAQVFAERSAFQANNVRCTCCTRRLTMFMNLLPRTRCYLCGYHVCVMCATSEKMETHNGRMASIMVCTRCRKTVTACDYEHMLTVSPGPVRIMADPVASSSSEKKMFQLRPSSLSGSSSLSDTSNNTSTSSSSSIALAEMLGEIIEDEMAGRREAALKVLQQLLAADQLDSQMLVDSNARLLDLATTRSKPMDAVQRAFDVDKYPADPALCEVASAEARPYPMLPVLLTGDAAERAESVKFPVPKTEDSRLAAIEHFKLHDVANIPELNVICTLAAAKKGTQHCVVTLIEKEVVTLMATNSPENWDVGSGNPREQTFCQHFVMEDRPLLVRHAEADMRFYHIAPVTMLSLRFYAGFPISVTNVRKAGPNDSEKVVVAVLCCLDEKPHDMTRSQYWRLTKLAEAASAILDRQAKECLEDPTKYPAKGLAAGSGSGVAVTC